MRISDWFWAQVAPSLNLLVVLPCKFYMYNTDSGGCGDRMLFTCQKDLPWIKDMDSNRGIGGRHWCSHPQLCSGASSAESEPLLEVWTLKKVVKAQDTMIYDKFSDL